MGESNIDYTVADDDGNLSNVATLTIRVRVGPIAQDDLSSGNTPGDSAVLNVLANDSTDDGTLEPTTIVLFDPSGTPDPDGTVEIPGEGTYILDPATGNVTFSPEAGFTADPTPISYTVNDSNGNVSNIATITVDYVPVASDDTSAANPPGPVSVDPLANDTNGDGVNPTTVNLTDSAATDSDGDGFNDSLVVPGEGEYEVDLLTGDVKFTPEPGFNDDPTPTTYTIQDDEGNLSNVATINIDYAPIASDDGAATSPDTPVTIPVLDNDTGDITDVTLTLVPPAGVTPNPDGSVTIPGEGTYSVNPTTNEVTFDPAPGFDGISTIEYTLTDTEGNTSPPATITVTMQAIPLAIDDVSLDNPPGSTVTVNPLVNDVDSDGDLDPSTVNLTDPAAADTNGDGFNDVLIVPGQGAYSVNPTTGLVTFEPEPGFNSDPTPTTYTVQDEAGNVSNVATITIDYVPVATDDSATTDPDTPVTIPILDNDSGDISTPIITLQPPAGITPNPDGSVTIPDEGTYVVNPNGTVTFTPEPGFNGPSTIDYTLTDDEGNVSNPATITVSPGLGPVANDDTAVTPPDVPVTVDILENDSDPDGVIDPTTVVLLDPVTGNPDPDGSVTIPGEGTYTVDPVTGEVTFDPEPGFTGDSSIPYVVSDDDGNVSNPATLTVTVGTGPIPPIANDDSAETPAGTPITIPLTANDTDSDGTIDVTTVTLLDPVTGTPVTTLTIPGEGTYVVNPDGSVTFDPVGGFSGLVTPVTYVVEDNDGNLSNPATIIINVLPDARDNITTTPAETPLSINVLGNDTGTLLPSSVTPTSTPSNGTVSVDNDPTSPTFGQIIYTPNPGFSGEDTFTYSAVDQDGNPVEATVIITVLPEANDDVQVVPPDAPVTFTVDDLLDNDLGDLDPTTFTIVTPPSDGTLSFNPVTGELVYTPGPDFDGTDSFVYEICDTAGNCVTATVQLVSLPAALDDEATTPVNTPVTVPVVENDIPLTSFDLSTLTVADGTNGLQPPSNGSVTVNPDGTIIYTPDTNFSGVDTFTYEICDPSASEPCRTAEVTVTVLPEASADSVETPAGTPVTLPLLDNDAGSLDPSTVSIASPPTNGTLFINPDGSIIYTPLPGFSGEDSFAYEVCDVEGNCTSAVATITVLPQAVDDDVPVPLDTPVVIPVLDNDNGDLDPTTVSIVTPPDNGTVTVDPVTGEITYTPDPGFSGEDSFVYEVCDGGGNCDTATVTVSVSEGDLLAIDDSELTDFDTPVTIPVLSNDIPGTAPLDPTSIDLDPDAPGQQTEVETPEGTFVANDDGTVTFTPADGFTGVAEVPYTISDVTGTTSNVATITVNVVPPGQADVSISKTIVSTPVVAGDVVTFQLIVSNSGPAAATNVTITDVVPDDIEDPEVSLDSGASFDPWTGSLNIGTLADGERIILLIRGTLADDAMGILSNTATVTADQDDPNPDDNSDTATADIVPPDVTSQLGVAKALSNVIINPDNGSFELTFDFVVENLGNVAVSDVQLTDDLEAAFGAGNFELISLTSDNLSVNPNFNGSSDINLLTGNDSLAAGEQATATLQVRVFTAGSYQNSALVSGQDPLGNTITDTSTAGLDPDPDSDGDPTNNDDATQVDLSPPGPLTALLQKEAAAGNYAIGDVIDYTLTVTNPSGNGEALVVTLRDTPPPATSYVEDSGTLRIGETSEPLEPTITDGQLVWADIVLDAGDTLTLSYQLRVLPGAQSPLENRAIVDAIGQTSGREVTSDEQAVEVVLEDGPFSLDISLLTGQVYIDTNQNGRFESGTDTPLPGARVILANGWQTTTDVQGNYVFRDVPSGVTSVLLDAQTAPYTPLPHPEATADPYQHRVRIQGVSVSDFPLAPRAGLITVSRETTVTAGPLTLTKQLVPLPEGVRVVIELQTTEPISNLVIIDPVVGTDDQRFEIDELTDSQTLTYDLPEQVPLTDPQLIWSDQ
ncbi:MAG: Ig-like domain-containing protein [Deinococcota bacterium]